MREKFMRFMQGRYGVDEFSRFLAVLGVIFIILDIFVRGNVLSLLALLILIYGYYRMFSKNYSKRCQENQKYLALKNQVKYKFSRQRSEMEQRKIYHIYRCPSCKQKIRVPKGKGKIIVTCPKCKTEFQRKS